MFPQGLSRNRRELSISCPPGGRYVAPRVDRRGTNGSGAVVVAHSTEEGGEPQGSRKGRPRNPLEGRGGPSGRIGRGSHSRDTELGCYVHETRPIICPWGRRLSRNPGVVSPLDEPAAGNLHGGVCEGGEFRIAMADLNAHEAGNGG